MMSYILIIVLYSGQETMIDFPTKAKCEAELVKHMEHRKEIKILECVEND
jgi:hypothetical protein